MTTVALLRPESFSVVPKAGAPGRPSPEAVTVHVPHAWTPPDPPPGPTSPDHTDLRHIIASPLNSQGSSGSGLHTLQACGGLADAIAELQQPRAHLGKARPSTSASEHQSHAAQSPSDEAVAGSGRADDDKGPEAAEESAAAVTAALRQIESGTAPLTGSGPPGGSDTICCVHRYTWLPPLPSVQTRKPELPGIACATQPTGAACPPYTAPCNQGVLALFVASAGGCVCSFVVILGRVVLFPSLAVPGCLLRVTLHRVTPRCLAHLRCGS